MMNNLSKPPFIIISYYLNLIIKNLLNIMSATPLLITNFLYQGSDIRPCTIFTDVEPDDLLAMMIFFTNCKPLTSVQIVISAWTNQTQRAHFLTMFLVRHFPHLKFKIFLGMGNEKEYDMSNILSCFPSTSAVQQYPHWTDATFHPHEFYLQMAPAQEIRELYRQHKDFSASTIAIYGSFNIRSLLNKSNELAVEFETMFNSFQKVLYYENFPASAPEYVQDVKITTALASIPMIGELLKWWNELIFEECKIDAHQEWAIKIMDSIQSCPYQFVNADTGLVMTLLMSIDAIPHLVTGVLDLPKSDIESGRYRPYPEIQHIRRSDSGIEQFLSVNTTDINIKMKHREIMDDTMRTIAGCFS